MQLSDVFTPDLIWSDLSSTNKSDVLRELTDLVAGVRPSLDREALYTALIEREKLGSTGVEDGVAIPHAKVKGLDNVILACGRSMKGMDFEAHDSKPTHLFFVLLAPMKAAGMHLKILARLSRLLKESRIRTKLMEAGSPQDIYKTIIDEDGKL